MKLIFLFLFIMVSPTLWASERIGAFGVEAGVARLSDGSSAAIGPSWMAHFEYQVDPVVGFFGQAGKGEAKTEDKRLMQTAFNGGLLIDLLPNLEFRFGIATTVTEIEDDESNERENELGPMVGTAVFITSGIWKIGGTGTVIRTESMQSAALRLMLLMMF